MLPAKPTPESGGAGCPSQPRGPHRAGDRGIRGRLGGAGLCKDRRPAGVAKRPATAAGSLGAQRAGLIQGLSLQMRSRSPTRRAALAFGDDSIDRDVKRCKLRDVFPPFSVSRAKATWRRLRTRASRVARRRCSQSGNRSCSLLWAAPGIHTQGTPLISKPALQFVTLRGRWSATGYLDRGRQTCFGRATAQG
jgi:hypothetical protein